MGEVYSWKGSHQEAISQYEAILVEEPRNIKVYKGLAQVYVWDNRLEEAEETYQEILKVWPQDLEARLGLAKVFAGRGSWSRAQDEYREVLKINPELEEAQEGLKMAERALTPDHDFIFRYIDEKDSGGFRAETFSYGYKYTQPWGRGNHFHIADYVQDLRETGQNDSIGNIVEFGGDYHMADRVTLLGSVDARTYENDPDFFAGVDMSAILRYYQRNRLTLRYTRNLFDVLDNIRENRFGVESNMHLNRFMNLNNSFAYTDYSDGNSSIDSFHQVTFLLLKKKPDFNVSAGYRRRDFDVTSSAYYSPQDLDSGVFSVYIGKTFEKHDVYGIFRFINHSDGAENFYYLLGNRYVFNETVSLSGDISFFDTSEDYEALAMTASCHLEF